MINVRTWLCKRRNHAPIGFTCIRAYSNLPVCASQSKQFVFTSEPIPLGYTNVTVLNAKLCLCGLIGRASPSDRVDGSTLNKNTGERDSILYGNMPLSASRPCLWPLTVPRTSTPLSVHNSCRCLVQNRGCIHFTPVLLIKEAWRNSVQNRGF